VGRPFTNTTTVLPGKLFQNLPRLRAALDVFQDAAGFGWWLAPREPARDADLARAARDPDVGGVATLVLAFLATLDDALFGAFGVVVAQGLH
jgi:hypothetical protein